MAGLFVVESVGREELARQQYLVSSQKVNDPTRAAKLSRE